MLELHRSVIGLKHVFLQMHFHDLIRPAVAELQAGFSKPSTLEVSDDLLLSNCVYVSDDSDLGAWH